MARLSSAILALAALSHPALAARQLSVRTYAPAAKQASSSNVVSSNVLSIKKTGKAAKSAGYLKSMRSGALSASINGTASEHVDDLLSEEYVASIEWDGVPVEVIIDTGSSDTWLVQAGFECVDDEGKVQSV